MAKTLTEFIDTHVKNSKIADYAGWVAAYGKDTERDYAERIAAADREFATSRSTYGATGDGLRHQGLSSGGYAAYLDGVAYAARSRARGDALTDRQTAEAENRRGYAAYLAADGETAETASDTPTAFGKLLSLGIVDETVAADYLIKLGVAEDEATELAALSTQIRKNSASTRKYLLELCTERMYNYNVAYRYAIAAGMSEAAAEDLASEVQASRDAYFNSYKNY